MTALETPRRTPGQRQRGWGLTSVPTAPRRMASVPFVLSLAVFLAFGMVGLLLLNTALQEQGFAVQHQQKVANQLGYRVAALEAEVTEARSSTGLAIEAARLGMVPNPYPVYLTLPDGRVVGDPRAMTGYEVPEVRYRTADELAALAAEKAAAEKQRLKDLAEAKKKAAEEERKKKKKAEAAAKKKAAEERKKKQRADESGTDR